MKQLLTLLATLLLLGLHTLRAQEIRYVKPGGTGDGTSWTNASGDLQDMINASSQQSTIQVWVAAGTYRPSADANGNTSPSNPRAKAFVMKNNVGIYGGFAGTETELTQRNRKTNVTILSGDIGTPGDASDNCLNVFANNLNELNSTAVLDGFTITGGTGGNGGGMFNYSSSPTIANCVFSGNTAGYGGGMFNLNASPVITNCVFSGNTAGSGGGIVNNHSSPAIINCVFSGNQADQGGGLYNGFQSSPTTTNCVFLGNTANFGGGVYNILASSVVINCSFSGNNAQHGGGVYNDHQGSSTITNSIIWNNSSGVSLGVAAAASITYSLVQNIAETDGNLNKDPQFVSSTDLRLQACSPAIGAGLNSANTTPTDLDGNIRTVGTIDMGAYEYQGPIAPSISTQPQSTQTLCQNSPAAPLVVDASGAGLTYQWYSNSSNSNTGGATISGANLASYTPPSSTAGTQYYYVEVSNSCGTTIPSSVAAVTVNVCTTCGNATNLTTTNITSSAARLNWVAAVDPAEWQVQYKASAPRSNWTNVQVAPSARSVQIRGLASRTTYNWRIRARCGTTWTAYSAQVSFTTAGARGNASIASRVGEELMETEAWQLQALPNPSATQFSIRLPLGKDGIVTIRVYDALGRLVETRTGLRPGTVVELGQNYRTGTYFCEVEQDGSRKVLKLVKGSH